MTQADESRGEVTAGRRSAGAMAMDESVPCPNCGYDLRGSDSRMCPECGIDTVAHPKVPAHADPLWIGTLVGLSVHAGELPSYLSIWLWIGQQPFISGFTTQIYFFLVGTTISLGALFAAIRLLTARQRFVAQSRRTKLTLCLLPWLAEALLLLWQAGNLWYG